MLSVGILIFNEVEVLDFAGPFEVFGISHDRHRQKLFKVFTVAEHAQIQARNGLLVQANYSFEQHPQIDVLVIPGGYGAEVTELHNPVLKAWVDQVHRQAIVTLSVCTGIFILAELGLLDGLEATTHWMDLQRLAEEYPKITVLQQVRYVEQGKIISSAGIASGIHASLYVVALLSELEFAENTAKRMEFDWAPASTLPLNYSL
ncbi:DJ-1/PfpI family protein [Acinetobacter pullicarnis]|uniref:DJ-1/PfpI family protein n=1 Tax=Acinetobacter pullicarnis TaxID=2576829 RepID=UPI0011220577|nr:DJ-1/PfpI family protein [Acinetobacter pullicarnis]